jgi:ribonuclease HI
MVTYELWFDGGARGNPGPAAAGVVIKDDEGRTVLEHGEYLGRATNNQAEYTAFRIGLEELFARLEQEAQEADELSLDVRTDSQLLQKQIDDVWDTNDDDLSAIQDEIRTLLSRLNNWDVQHVPREENKQADRLVNETLDQRNK